MSNWRDIVKEALKVSLPGAMAHELMAPSVRFTGTEKPDRNLARHSSVLILMYPTKHGMVIPFIQRPDYAGVHGGQISLPGGKCEPDDSCNWNTALRETHEELGIETKLINQLGELTALYIPNSNYIVYPQVGYLNERPLFNPNSFEVKELFEVPVKLFFESEKKVFSKLINGHYVKAPFFDVEGRQIWGATAMIMSEFAVVLSENASEWVSAIRSCSAHISQESP